MTTTSHTPKSCKNPTKPRYFTKYSGVWWRLFTVGLIASFAWAASEADSLAAAPERGSPSSYTRAPAREAPALARVRDQIHVRRCDRFVYDGRSPSLAVCRALLRATRRVSYRGRKANRRWVSNPATLKLLRVESGYSPKAVNPSSGACGLGQTLPCEKYGRGTCWPTTQQQADCFVMYVLGRYRTPERAWNFWLSNGWY
jgi:hypothetical protein